MRIIPYVYGDMLIGVSRPLPYEYLNDLGRAIYEKAIYRLADRIRSPYFVNDRKVFSSILMWGAWQIFNDFKTIPVVIEYPAEWLLGHLTIRYEATRIHLRGRINTNVNVFACVLDGKNGKYFAICGNWWVKPLDGKIVFSIKKDDVVNYVSFKVINHG